MIFRRIILSCFLLMFLPVGFLEAQELYNGDRGVFEARVLNILDQEMRLIPGTDTEHLYQSIEAVVLTGPERGEVIVFENDYLTLKEGNRFYFSTFVDFEGLSQYSVVNINRSFELLFLLFLFIFTVLFFGGWQGARSLLALLGSFLIIIYVLIPGLLSGWNPLLASILVAGGILFAAIFFTHGFNRESVVAYVGTMIAVFLTGILAVFSVSITSLSGFASDESIYLNFNTGGTLNFTALLLGAIIIGVLGVLDDIAVTQSAVVSELYDSNKDMSRGEVYKRALRVGREHVGALVNTLVLAYTATSLPLLLLFYFTESSLIEVINREVFATEIVRIIVGSIGLILTVPIVTLLAAFYLKGYKRKGGHSHSHGHIH